MNTYVGNIGVVDRHPIPQDMSILDDGKRLRIRLVPSMDYYQHMDFDIAD